MASTSNTDTTINYQNATSANTRQFTHVISDGETIQQISANYLNDVTQWKTVADYNQLEYPYIVDTPQQKMSNVSHLLTTGDTIVIPANINLSALNPTALPKKDQKTIEEIALGSDLAIDYVKSSYSSFGTYDHIAEFKTNDRGDLLLARGSDNLKQTLVDHLFTRKGTLALHLNYGSRLYETIGQDVSIYLSAVRNSIQSAFEADSRVAKAKCTHIEARANIVYTTWEVIPQGLEKSWQFVLQGDETGNFTLIN